MMVHPLRRFYAASSSTICTHNTIERHADNGTYTTSASWGRRTGCALLDGSERRSSPSTTTISPRSPAAARLDDSVACQSPSPRTRAGVTSSTGGAPRQAPSDSDIADDGYERAANSCCSCPCETPILTTTSRVENPHGFPCGRDRTTAVDEGRNDGNKRDYAIAGSRRYRTRHGRFVRQSQDGGPRGKLSSAPSAGMNSMADSISYASLLNFAGDFGISGALVSTIEVGDVYLSCLEGESPTHARCCG